MKATQNIITSYQSSNEIDTCAMCALNFEPVPKTRDSSCGELETRDTLNNQDFPSPNSLRLPRLRLWPWRSTLASNMASGRCNPNLETEE